MVLYLVDDICETMKKLRECSIFIFVRDRRTVAVIYISLYDVGK